MRMVALACALVLLILAFWASVVYVAIHFIVKFW